MISNLLRRNNYRWRHADPAAPGIAVIVTAAATAAAGDDQCKHRDGEHENLAHELPLRETETQKCEKLARAYI
jgi:hypothetical protein